MLYQYKSTNTDAQGRWQRALEANGAEFPDSFVVTLHALILRMRPKKKPKTEVGARAKKCMRP